MNTKCTKLLWLLAFLLPMCAQAQVTIYSNNFNSAAPWGMTTSDLTGTNVDHVWIEGSNTPRVNQTGGSGDYAVADSDNLCDSDPWNSVLVTPSLDFSTYVNVELTFRSRLRLVFNNDLEEGHVEASTDGGSNWQSVYTSATSQPNGGVLVTVDLSAYDLTPNVKLRWRYVDDYLCAWYWQIDDVSITGDLAQVCTSPPTGGTAVAASSTVCAGGNAQLSLTGNTAGIGQTYQWQSSPDGFVWTNISGATGSTATVPVSDSTYFRSILTCSGLSDTSNGVLVATDFMLCYCSPIHTGLFGDTDCSFDYTSNVTFGTINNDSDCGGTSPYNYSDYTALSTQVIKGVTYPISITTDGDTEGIGVWIDFDHSGTYDASEFVFHGYTGDVPQTYTGTVTIPTTALSGTTRMRVRNKYGNDVAANEACATFGYGEVEEYSIEILSPPADEAGVVAITRPAIGTCSLGTQVWVTLQNLGTNDLTSATFVVKVNNLPVAGGAWTGLVAAGDVSEVLVPVNYSFADGDSISVTVTNPNGQTEDPAFVFNNHVGRRVYAGLSGDKSVYGVTADYADLDEALEDLVLRGVCDTVYFKVAAGTYNTQHVLSPYAGAGPGRLAVIESADGNPSSVTFSVAGSAGSNYVFQVNDGSYYAIRNLTAQATGTTYAGVIEFTGTSHHIELGNNIFKSDTAATYVGNNFDKTIISTNYANSTDFDNLWIHENQLIGGCRSFDMEIEDGEYQSGIVIDNNDLSKFSVLGILSYNTSGLTFTNNKVRPRADIVNENYGVYVIQGIGGGSISGNDIALQSYGMGILLSDVVGGSNPVLVSNNFIYVADSSSSNVANGISITPDFYSVNNVTIANNSVSIRTDNIANAGIYIGAASTGVKVINNNVGSFGDAPALFVGNNADVEQIQNNNLFGNQAASILGNTYATATAMQNAGYGQNNLSVNPGFSGMDLHTCAVALNGSGLALSNVTEDIDGDARSATPDIGADEFLGDAGNLLLEDEFLKCPNEQVTIGNATVDGVTYSWTPANTGSQITVTAAGTYVVTATSVCGTFADTATVTNKPLPVASFSTASVGLTGIFTNTSTNATAYSWDFGDGNSSTDQNPSHVYSAAGTYSVTLTVTNECGTDTEGPLPVNVINASIEENKNIEIGLMPNPTDGIFTITMANISMQSTTISIMDVTGKVLLNKNIPAGTNQVSFDVSHFASGVYTVRVSNGAHNKVLRLVRK